MARKTDDKRVMARFAFGYGDQQLDTGQVIRLKGLPNDEKLLTHRYFVPFEGKETYVCSVDGAEFAEDWQRVAHGEKIAPQTHHERVEAVERAKTDRRHPDLQHEVRV
jgi:hypothetical protein